VGDGRAMKKRIRDKKIISEDIEFRKEEINCHEEK
jgi:hypothetical protein